MPETFFTSENKNVKIKICGLFREDDIVMANKFLPDFAGFIFAESPRMIDFKTAQIFRQKLDKKIKAVGVFVDEKIEKILELTNAKTIDIIQLHGNEDNKYIQKLKAECNLTIIKTIKPGYTKVLPDAADWLLFDNFSEKLKGGTGKTFDWSLIPKTDKPIILAGGLNAGNAIKAIKTVKPFALDFNSGLETNGRKDFRKIEEVIKIVRGYKHE